MFSQFNIIARKLISENLPVSLFNVKAVQIWPPNHWSKDVFQNVFCCFSVYCHKIEIIVDETQTLPLPLTGQEELLQTKEQRPAKVIFFLPEPAMRFDLHIAI